MLKLKWKVYDMLSNEEIRKAFQNIDISRYDSRLSPHIARQEEAKRLYNQIEKMINGKTDDFAKRR